MKRLLCRRNPPDKQPEEESVQLYSEEEEKARKVKEKLFKAIQEKNIDEITTLIRDFDLNVKEVKEGPSKKTVLHSLAESTCTIQEEEKVTRIFKLFFEAKGCDVNAKDKFGNTPLKLAAEKGNIPVLKLLLDHKADVDEKDNFSGDAPLHWAAKKDMVEAIDTLITVGQATVNIQNKSHATPLHHAVENNHKNAVLLLLYHKAASNLENEKHETPERYAETNNFSDVQKILKEYKSCETLESLIAFAEENKCSEVIQLFKKPPEVQQFSQMEPVVADSGNASNNRSNTNVTVNYNILVKMQDSAQAAIGNNPTLKNYTTDGKQSAVPYALPETSSQACPKPTAPTEESLSPSAPLEESSTP